MPGIKYDVEGMKKEHRNVRPTRLDSIDNPTLEELLKFGSLRSLALAVVAGEVPEPWETVALSRLPTAAMVLGIYDHANDHPTPPRSS